MNAPPFLTSPLIAVPHAMFSRLGGVSTGPFSSLNLSYGVGDEREKVFQNRQMILKALSFERLVSLGQAHGTRLLALTRMPEQEEYSGYDAVISSVPGLGLLIQHADCQAVLLYDPIRRVVAAVHSGWRGSAANIIGAALSQMREKFAVDPGHIFAAISPSLGPCCAEFLNYKRELPSWMRAFCVRERPAHFNFWAISQKQLIDAGLAPDHISIAGICTRCNREYFSFRRAKTESAGVCGRNGSVIALPYAA